MKSYSCCPENFTKRNINDTWICGMSLSHLSLVCWKLYNKSPKSRRMFFPKIVIQVIEIWLHARKIRIGLYQIKKVLRRIQTTCKDKTTYRVGEIIFQSFICHRINLKTIKRSYTINDDLIRTEKNTNNQGVDEEWSMSLAIDAM